MIRSATRALGRLFRGRAHGDAEAERDLELDALLAEAERDLECREVLRLLEAALREGAITLAIFGLLAGETIESARAFLRAIEGVSESAAARATAAAEQRAADEKVVVVRLVAAAVRENAAPPREPTLSELLEPAGRALGVEPRALASLVTSTRASPA